MLYKVTPAMEPRKAEKKAGATGQARPKRKSAIYDSEGNEVLITLMCLKCRQMRPLAQFGLRKMADGAIRNQPWCRACRSAATSKAKQEDREKPALASAVPLALHVAEMPPPAMKDLPPLLSEEAPTDPSLPAGDVTTLGATLASASPEAR